MATPSRPLSPHVRIYRWQISNTLSILHRLSGVVLAVSFLLFSIWLVSAADGAASYEPVIALLSGPLGILVLLGLSAAFFFHLLNGIRHLFWDAGLGFERQQSRLSGWMVVGGTVLLALAVTAWVLK